MTTKTYTNAEIVAAARDAVAEKGAGYIYSNPSSHGPVCVYAALDGAPSCIVGHVLAKIDPEAFASVAEWERDPHTVGTGVREAFADLELNFTVAQVIVLEKAQNLQDHGRYWGVALREIEGLEAA
ncbi:hypothetical protein [Streptomyces sp. AC495_CC817]|uniref:hypothetical protein n=1 Tax=Streptomyces sp. AC495_CC817 TaxID=2823900 RepID=UPI001C25DF60|nr:hypothetical protein [Streptomyces sp. AC495_CC817]